MNPNGFEIVDRVGTTARRAARPYFESLLACGEFPQLAALMKSDAAGGIMRPEYGPQFERGLTWLLDGIAADLRP